MEAAPSGHAALTPITDELVYPSDKLFGLDPFIFAHPVRRDILHLCVVHHLDALRQGSASTKTRGDVRGSDRKIRPRVAAWRVLATAKAPCCAADPRDFSTKLPRKVIQMGMRVALSARLKEQGLGVVESLDLPGFKTKELAARVKELGWEKTLFVTGLEDIPEGLDRSSRNLPRVEVAMADELTVYDIMKWPRLVLDVSAVGAFERSLGKHAQAKS
ncbi:hypothetical protein EIP86_000116 [Pleurotus ostreatoroseus]|nr:hypothetical protein EIP86_000116 [Pleurotus ostreatoroseus]